MTLKEYLESKKEPLKKPDLSWKRRKVGSDTGIGEKTKTPFGAKKTQKFGGAGKYVFTGQ